MAISIRLAQKADAPLIARLHFHTWRETYRDLAPQAAFDGVTEEVRLARWQSMLADEGSERIILVAEIDGQLAGFGMAGPPSHEIFQGRAEIKFLYVGAAFKRQGVGRELLLRLARHMMKAGYDGVGLGVVAGNDPAIAFYEGMRGTREGNYTDPGPIWRSDNHLYVWDDLPAITAHEGNGSS
ncbi:GNAT family N-acetyltransferase [Microvirga mediterraneensis]|uniref:GNAT family N-acetyltransferase n=1 Tax=Microvirga mediterraneensis TaxID=2754695 RepID=A0A838BMT1_9HYPH|nr:GNAT family N-acetyltransferase [Microvirga mediterraneensis]MBA1156837.1 GNAT family N-acetyltransferase [Microvirga mediterraneensis]